MPYNTLSGGFERASRLGHSNAIVRAMAERADFYVPAEQAPDLTWLATKVRSRDDFHMPAEGERLSAAIGVDGSYVVISAREGLPSVRYGYAQAAAIWLDLDAMDEQRRERFVDPAALGRAVNSALISFDLPVSGAFTRRGVSIQDSWRERIDGLFRAKKVEVNRLNQSLLQLLMLLHGEPGTPASTVPVNCPGCKEEDIPVAIDGRDCPRCSKRLSPTDTMRIFEDVIDDGANEEPLGRLMRVVELLVVVGLATLLWEQSRDELLRQTLFVMDGPMAVYGPPAKLRARALEYFQAMTRDTSSKGPYLCGIEKSGPVVDYGTSLVRHEALKPQQLLVIDADVIRTISHSPNPQAYGSETYWGRKFIYRSADGRVVVFTALPEAGPPYDDHGGQPDPKAYPTLPYILDVIDRTGSSMYRDGLIPIALAHSKAAYPIGVGTDVLKLAARRKLGLDSKATASATSQR